jgi:hypothetical protein
MSASPAPQPAPHHLTQLPPAVQRAAAEAEALMNGGSPKPEEEPQQEPQPEYPPEQQPPPQQEPEEEEQPQEAQHERDWRNDFNAMKGRYERAEAEKRSMVERLNGLEALLAQVTTRPAEGPNPAELEPQRFLTDKEVEEYGTEFVDVQKRAALEAVSPEIQALKKEISYLKRGVGAVGENIAKTAKERVYDALDEVIGPQWEDINNHDSFKHWLSYIDPYSGRQRKDMLSDAFSRHDASRVVTFFRGFLAEAAATDPRASQGARQQTPANGQANGRPPLANYAAPGRAGSAAQPSSAGKPVYTRADISAFYRGLTAGVWRGREAEATAIDADIIAAGNEGRVAP